MEETGNDIQRSIWLGCVDDDCFIYDETNKNFYDFPK